ncbi:Spy0128 family protein [Streptococcus rifensis]
MDKNRFLKALIAMTASLSFLFAGLFASANAVEAKELTNVITEISLLDGSDTTQTTDSEGVYNIRTGNAYKLRALFDLKAYNGNLEDGDYFTLDIPAPMDVYNNTLQLVDNDTKVNIATAVVTKTGLNQGGKVTITLKNLDEYKEATNSQVVKDVQGNFAASFRFTSDQTNTAIPFDSSSVQGTITHKYSSKTISGTEEGYENFAKAGGQASRTPWESPILASAGFVGNGSYVSNWRVRVNTGGQDYGKNLVLTDSLPTGAQYAAIRYIPETVTVYEAPSMSGGTSAVMGDFVKLVENTDYVLAWNDNYTEFTITFKDGSKKYFVTYQTTTPNDGSTVANQIGLTTEDGTVLTQRSNNTRTTMVASATSLVSGEISASPAYKIRISKTDSFTQAPVGGAVYTITQKDDTSNTQEVTTNQNGIAISSEFEKDQAGKVFIIKEKTAPEGYQLDEKEYEVTLGAAGTLVNLQDVSIPAKVTIEATKALTGRDLLAEEFTFNLLNQAGKVVATAKNTADGKVVFADVEFAGAGVYNYTIKEDVSNPLPGITYDDEAKAVTITVTSNAGVLSGVVSTETPNFANKYGAKPTTLTIKARKEIVGDNAPSLVADQFEFELLNESKEVVATATNDADGLITFADVAFDAVGTYNFTVKEKEGSVQNIRYDYEEKPLTVQVTDENGQLKAVVISPEDPILPTISNEYITTTTTTSTTTTSTTTTSTTTTSTTTTAPTTTTVAPTTTVATTTEAPATTTVATTTEAPATTTVATTTEAPATTTVATTTPAPVVTTPAPVVTTPAPVVTTPAPVVTTPAPVVTTPAPVVTTPAPVVTTPAPVVTTPAPVVTTPAPVVTTPAPVVTTPAPVVTTPAPVVTTPKVPAPPASPKSTTVTTTTTVPKSTKPDVKNKRTLPSTGETVGYASVIGLVLLAVLGTFYYRSHKN